MMVFRPPERKHRQAVATITFNRATSSSYQCTPKMQFRSWARLRFGFEIAVFCLIIFRVSGQQCTRECSHWIQFGRGCLRFGHSTMGCKLYFVPSRVWTVPSLCSWKILKNARYFRPQWAGDGPPARSNPTARRGRNYLEFFKSFMNIGTELSTLSMGQSIV